MIENFLSTFRRLRKAKMPPFLLVKNQGYVTSHHISPYIHTMHQRRSQDRFHIIECAATVAAAVTLQAIGKPALA
jgi:hypothetical protein